MTLVLGMLIFTSSSPSNHVTHLYNCNPLSHNHWACRDYCHIVSVAKHSDAEVVSHVHSVVTHIMSSKYLLHDQYKEDGRDTISLNGTVVDGKVFSIHVDSRWFYH